MREHKRLGGIDLFRGLAIYAVIILHIDESVKAMSPGWSKITDFALFAVPFFLAMSFYLAINKLYLSQSSYPLRSRLLRLLIPYGVWSIFYLIYKSAKYLVAGESSKFLGLFGDPLSLVFFGGAAFHLYFLPLLSIGTLLIKLVEFLSARNISVRKLGILALVSLLIYEVVLLSGNELKTPANVAFEPLLAVVFPGGNSHPLLRLLLVVIFWTLRCLPYIMVAMLLAHPAVNQRCFKLINRYSLLWILTFLVFNTFGDLLMPQSIYEVSRGFTALIAALAASTMFNEYFLIKSLGYCSFGIYLIHLFFTEIFQSVAIRLYPDYVHEAKSIFLLLASTIVLLISWGITVLLMQRKNLSLILFGLKQQISQVADEQSIKKDQREPSATRPK